MCVWFSTHSNSSNGFFRMGIIETRSRRLDEPLRNVGHLVGCAAEARPDPHPTTAVQVDAEKVLTIVWWSWRRHWRQSRRHWASVHPQWGVANYFLVFNRGCIYYWFWQFRPFVVTRARFDSLSTNCILSRFFLQLLRSLKNEALVLVQAIVLDKLFFFFCPELALLILQADSDYRIGFHH